MKDMTISEEIRANIARAEEADRKRIQQIANDANERDGVNKGAAAREAAERQAEQDRQQAQEQRERDRLAQIEAEARQQARLAWIGSEEAFTAAWPQMWAQYQIDTAAKALADGQTAIRLHYQRHF
jgi:hypothetical protein